MILIAALFLPVTLYYGIYEMKRTYRQINCKHGVVIEQHWKGMDSYCLDCNKIM